MEAAIWDHGQLTNLGVRGIALSINNRGQVLVRGGPQPILWQNGRSHTLPMLPQSFRDEAVSINDTGLIVGSAQLKDNKEGDRALLWRNGHIYDLISPGSGWILRRATKINAKGQIAGNGTLHGQPHAFLLTPL